MQVLERNMKPDSVVNPEKTCNLISMYIHTYTPIQSRSQAPTILMCSTATEGESERYEKENSP